MALGFVTLFEALNGAGARYVVVGGLAMVLHGVDRLTADVDLVVDLAPEHATTAMGALVAAGYRPAVPVDPADFADPACRARWREERGLVVLSLWDPTNTRPAVDVLADPPIAYAELAERAARMRVGGVEVPVASVTHLIRMKLASGRARDLEDIARLRNHVRESEE